MKYAKLKNGQPLYMRGVHNMSNPTEAQTAAYAADHGFKPVSTSPAPGRFYTESWTETDTSIENAWTPIDLEEAKEQAKEQIQQELTFKLSARTVLDCEGVENGVIYDDDALKNAMADFMGAEYIIDAKDVPHKKTPELVEAYKASLVTYRNNLYQEASVRRIAVDRAATVDEVEAALK